MQNAKLLKNKEKAYRKQLKRSSEYIKHDVPTRLRLLRCFIDIRYARRMFMFRYLEYKEYNVQLLERYKYEVAKFKRIKDEVKHI